MKPLVAAYTISTCFSTGCGWNCACFRISTSGRARQHLLRRGVEVRAELSESRHLAETVPDRGERSRDLLHALICAAPPTRETDRPTFTRTYAGKEESLSR